MTKTQRTPEHRYALRSHPSYWFMVGRSHDRQALWGLLGEEPWVVEFDNAGIVQKVTRHEIAALSDDPLGALSAAIRAEGYSDHPISIRRFHIDHLNVGIEDLSEAFREFVEQPGTFTAEEHENLEPGLTEWLASGSFAFRWDSEFDVTAEGWVDGS